MPASYQIYNHTPKDVIDQTVDWGAMKCMLLNNDAVFNASDATLAAVAGVANVNEVAGSGWTVGGEDVTVTFETYDTNSARALGAQISVTAVGGDIGTAYKFVLYNDAHADDRPFAFCTFDGPRIANEGTPFIIDFADEGIFFDEPAA